MARYELVNPADDRRGASRPLAPRLRSLAGARVALLDNRKGNANVLLRRIGESLTREYGVAALPWEEKRIYSRPAADEQIERLVAESDAVVAAIGD